MGSGLGVCCRGFSGLLAAVVLAAFCVVVPVSAAPQAPLQVVVPDSLWAQIGEDIDGEAAFDNSGFSVAVNAAGDRVIVGAPLNDGAGDSAGQVRVFGLDAGVWVQIGADINGENAGDWAGYSVAMNAAGDRVIVGAHLNDDGGSDSGHVRVFGLNAAGDGWVQIGADINGENVGDTSGWSVAMNAAGDRVIVGAVRNDGGGTNSGQARVFGLDAGVWVQIGEDIKRRKRLRQFGFFGGGKRSW